MKGLFSIFITRRSLSLSFTTITGKAAPKSQVVASDARAKLQSPTSLVRTTPLDDDEQARITPPSTQKLKFYKPRTPGLRHRIDVDKSELYKGRPIPWLTTRLYKTGGRGNEGHIASFHRGGGHKRLYRFIDFKRTLYDVPAVVQRIEYDPNRSSYIALVEYQNQEKKIKLYNCTTRITTWNEN